MELRCYFIVVVALICLLCADGAKILAVFSFPGRSQYIFAENYLKELAARGHNVTVINTFGEKATTQKTNNFHVIGATKIHKLMAEYSMSDYDAKASQWKMLSLSTEFINLLSINVLEEPAVQRLMQSGETFDLLIVETVQNEVLFGLAQHFKALTIGISSYGTDTHIDELMGNISPLSYNPMLLSSRSEKMKFVERFWNVWEASIVWLHKHWVRLPSQRQLYKQYFPNATVSLQQAMDSFSLMLLGQHFTLSYPRSYLPNMIEVGGLHLRQQQSKPQALPSELDAFINQATAGVIYFSMGSNIKSADFPEATRNILLETFASLPQRVLWKFEQQELPNKPANVFISNWFPQSDILGHPKLRLFITHGGLLSTIESLYYGKPVLGLPVFYDQHLNVQRAKQAGYGLGLDLWTMNSTQLRASIVELLEDPSYAQAAQQKSRLFLDQKETALERAIWWTEYVLRHEGAGHMRAASKDLNLLELHGVDVWSLLCGAAFLSCLLSAWLLKLVILKPLCWCLTRRQDQKNTKLKSP